ncbi:putative Ribonuclease P/MRP protein subunit POP5 [Zostera marina]|uniref:Ribonuclease P/MRP protein subunit POP5 n=1 Tax=Zostera marina TaxID=29655 RepID=A0A0K9NJY7_ZOSMR|nr:putative Ribonuclease P/MRP protein subunit POP5 [Zostera marina]
MAGFKNRYLVMEVFLDPNKELGREDPILLTNFNVSKAIKESIFSNFGECGLGSALGSFHVKYVNRITKVCIIRVSRDEHQKIWSAITMVRSIGGCPVVFNLLDLSGSIRVSRKTALKCDQAKFEQFKNLVGDRLTPEVIQECTNCFEKIKLLEQ